MWLAKDGREIHKVAPSLWTFARAEGGEPTNNAAYLPMTSQGAAVP